MNDGLIGWNFANVVSITLIGAIVWAAMGLASNFIRSRSQKSAS